MAGRESRKDGCCTRRQERRGERRESERLGCVVSRRARLKGRAREVLGPMTLGGRTQSSVEKPEAISSRSNSWWVSSSQTTQRYLRSEQEIALAVSDNLGI